MGKKYIIELEDKPFHKGNGDFLYRVKGFNSLVFDMNGVGKLTPYTEPDMEQVRKEAYEKGLSDAWDAATKIANIPYGEEEKVFGSGGWKFIINHTASEAIEKIRAYEKEKEKQIQVGDEVTTASGKAVVTGVGPVHFEYVFADGSHGYDKVKNVKKTGRHFPEIAEVLQKMREDKDDV